MSRGRLLASLNYRSKGVTDMSISNTNLRNIETLQVYGASSLNDAFSSPSLLFSVKTGRTYLSPTLKQKRFKGQEDSKRDLTNFLFNLDDFATVPQVGVTRIPPDSDIVYLRLRGVLRDGSATRFGPIVAVPPYDFFGVTVPFFTTVGNAPDLATNGVIPDVLGEGCLNIHLPYFSGTFNIKNFSQAQGGANLFFSLSAGMTPSILRPGEELTVTGVSVPEVFVASDGGTPLFSIRCGIVNRG
jgi:hypothetical protein